MVARSRPVAAAPALRRAWAGVPASTLVSGLKAPLTLRRSPQSEERQNCDDDDHESYDVDDPVHEALPIGTWLADRQTVIKTQTPQPFVSCASTLLRELPTRPTAPLTAVRFTPVFFAS